MAVPISVPRLGWTMEEGTFVEWLKRDGDRIEPGEALFALESDKATENIEALDAGILRLAPDSPGPGTKVVVGQVIGYLAVEGEAVAPVRNAGPAPVIESPAPQPSGPAEHAYGRPAPASATRAVSPRARRVARELGVDWSAVHGSGRSGRVRERDIRAVARSEPEGRLVPLTSIRRTIAHRMIESVTHAAPVTLTTEADATELVGVRKRLTSSAGQASDTVPTYSDLIVKLTARVLKQHPGLQAQWRDDGLFMPAGIHIGLAVDTDAGLLVPVLRDADQLTLAELSARARELTVQARAGRLTGEQMRGGTFTVSNLGMFGIDAFTPLLQLPQAAVLGVGRIRRGPAVVDDQVVPRDLMTLSLTFDHRVIDGAPAARFLDALRTAMEEGRLD